MAELNATFRGLNTEVYPDRLPDGTADVALNVTVRNGDIAKRAGFAQVEDDADGAAGAILNGTVVRFADGDIYIVVKIGAKLYQRKMYPSDAGSFTEITLSRAAHATDRGWFFLWADRLHYFDRNGGHRWNPDVNGGVAYKAGLPRPRYGVIPQAAVGGEKDGYYHTVLSYRNKNTGEEGVVTASHTPDLECRIETPDTRSGVSVANWTDIAAADSDHEWTHAHLWTSRGNTERIGLGAGVECFSYRYYPDVLLSKSSVLAAGLNKADHVLNPNDHLRNDGGEPPGALFGCFNGRHAVYGGIYAGSFATLTTALAGNNNDLKYTATIEGGAGNAIRVRYTAGATAGAEVVTVSGRDITVQVENGVSTATQVSTAVSASAAAIDLVSVANADGNDGSGAVATMSYTALTGGGVGGNSATPGEIRFSKPGFPTMVPMPADYRNGGDAQTLEPRPWRGQIIDGLPGSCAAASWGGLTLVFATTATWQLRPDEAGRLWASSLLPNIGCVGQAACVGTPGGVFAFGYRKLIRFGSQGWRDLTKDVLGPTLEDVPVAYQHSTVLGYFGDRNEVWAAVVKNGQTAARRIIVHSLDDGQFVIFEPACLAAGEGIVAMCEMAVPNAAPVMLVFTSAGRILKYPSGTADVSTHFAAQWRGYFLQSQQRYEHLIENIRVHAGSNVSGNVTFGIRQFQTGGETITQQTHALTKSSAVERIGAQFQNECNYVQVEFASANTVTSQWSIRNLNITATRAVT
ncbi:MAG: hypothetical protein PHU85_00555 [Phycisphaerae bacterium]|nr:hypothetical protein [Phycisphaerae bacterium]